MIWFYTTLLFNLENPPCYAPLQSCRFLFLNFSGKLKVSREFIRGKTNKIVIRFKSNRLWVLCFSFLVICWTLSIFLLQGFSFLFYLYFIFHPKRRIGAQSLEICFGPLKTMCRPWYLSHRDTTTWHLLCTKHTSALISMSLSIICRQNTTWNLTELKIDYNW